MTRTTRLLEDARRALRELLARGPRESRLVVAEMIKRGFTTKQVRAAREHELLQTRREGRRSSARSIWSLPSAPTHAGSMASVPRVRAYMAESVAAAGAGGSIAREVSAVASVMTDSKVGGALDANELSRVDRRSSVFTRRGVDAVEARSLAIKLVIERDRHWRPALVACPECAAFPLDAPYPCEVGRKPIGVLHACWFARPDPPI